MAEATRARLLLTTAGMLIVAALAAPRPADAHLRSGTVAVDYRAIVLAPQTAAYSAQIFQSDRAIGLTIKPGHMVQLIGYLGEPVFRLDRAGLWVNAASPTAVVLKLLAKSDRVLSATPRWRLQAGRKSVIWQDARAQGLPPGVSIGVWHVPVIVDGQRTELRGLLRHFPQPALWPWLAILAGLLAAGAIALVRRAGAQLARASIAFGVAAALASMLMVVSFSLDAYASPGTWIEAFDVIAFLGVGLWILYRGPERYHVAAAIGLGVVGVAVGLLDGAVFFHPIVLAVLPATLIRVLAIVAIGAGSDAAAIGCRELL